MRTQVTLAPDMHHVVSDVEARRDLLRLGRLFGCESVRRHQQRDASPGLGCALDLLHQDLGGLARAGRSHGDEGEAVRPVACPLGRRLDRGRDQGEPVLLQDSHAHPGLPARAIRPL